MERLWSPWRMAYIESAKGHDPDACIFCDLPRQGDEAAYILGRNRLAFAILNAYPYNPGHLMVAPVRHVADLEALEPPELADVSSLLQRAVRALKAAAGPDGFNLGVNLGRVAGAGVPGHVHWHVVPRWNGDTNFMGVLGETRVIPEELRRSYEKLRALFGAEAETGPNA